MSRILCALGRHKIAVRYFLNSRWKINNPWNKRLCAVAICDRCGKELSAPSNIPRAQK